VLRCPPTVPHKLSKSRRVIWVEHEIPFVALASSGRPLSSQLKAATFVPNLFVRRGQVPGELRRVLRVTPTSGHVEQSRLGRARKRHSEFRCCYPLSRPGAQWPGGAAQKAATFRDRCFLQRCGRRKILFCASPFVSVPRVASKAVATTQPIPGHQLSTALWVLRLIGAGRDPHRGRKGSPIDRRISTQSSQRRRVSARSGGR
jgi:hypothetical protein